MYVLPTVVTRGIKRPASEAFPARLLKARKAVGISASALSDAAAIGQASVALMERGLRFPRIRTTVRLAAVLQISPALLAFGDRRDLGGEPDPDGLPARLREARTALGVSVREVDRRAGTKSGTIHAIEEGGQTTITMAEKLASALQVSAAWLAFGLGDRAPFRGSLRLQATPAQQA